MPREIVAKILLSRVGGDDDWFGLRYNMNLYRGCQHQCIYCDSRSECYGIDDFAEVSVKANAIELLRKELTVKRIKGTIGLGSMNDPYMPLEAQVALVRRALEVIAEHRFPIHIVTKSDLVLRDLEVLRRIARVYAAVSFTVTTADDDLARKVEPGAPLPSARFAAMQKLAAAGILTGVLMMPILPFIEDSEGGILAIVERSAAAGADYILPWFGMSLRDRQRAWYYGRLDVLFPGLRQKYELKYGDRYDCRVPNARRLDRSFRAACRRLGIATVIPKYRAAPRQAELF